MSDDLEYRVRGGGGEIYTIRAHGFRETFEITCTCRGFAKSRRICRHIAKLLVGDISDAVDQSKEFRPLFLASEHTAICEVAFKFKDAKVSKISMLPAFYHFRDRFEPMLIQRGWAIEMDERVDPETGRQMLSLHGYHQNGKMKKSPSHVIVYTPMDWNTVAQPDGSLARENLRSRSRPWVVNGIAYETLGAAAAELLRAAGVLA